MSHSLYYGTLQPQSTNVESPVVSPLSDDSSFDFWRDRSRRVSDGDPSEWATRPQPLEQVSPISAGRSPRPTSALSDGSGRPSWSAAYPQATGYETPTSPSKYARSRSSSDAEQEQEPFDVVMWDPGSRAYMASGFVTSDAEQEPFDVAMWDPKSKAYMTCHDMTSSSSEEGEHDEGPSFRSFVKKTSERGLNLTQTATSFVAADRSNGRPTKEDVDEHLIEKVSPTSWSDISNDSLELSSEPGVTAAPWDPSRMPTSNWYEGASSYPSKPFDNLGRSHDPPYDTGGYVQTGATAFGQSRYPSTPQPPITRPESNRSQFFRKMGSKISTFFSRTGKSDSESRHDDWFG